MFSFFMFYLINNKRFCTSCLLFLSNNNVFYLFIGCHFQVKPSINKTGLSFSHECKKRARPDIIARPIMDVSFTIASCV
ncbi:hypothetical protein Dda3937_00117 [Dickeya dadantii 3937]|uniref:Uncharacterized protein n=1 Tax=Dickeya dadantii (strain 3937) TaxID=198628 RepID=E0SF59_DICD3|nr:hypothetical protein Dda3937_00117 [Dickeya dadantii 3937]